MKKIIFSLLAVALMVTSCDKDAVDGDDYSSINVAQEAVEIGASVDTDFDLAKAQLESLMGIITKSNVPSVSTSRGGDNGINWIELSAFNGSGADASAIFVHVLSEETAISCYDSFSYNGGAVVPNTYSWDSTGRDASTGILTIEVAGATQAFDIGGSLRDTYVGSFDSALDGVFRVALTSNGGFSVSGSQPNRNEFTFDACGSGSVDISGYYEVSPAPFPLVGFLATILDGAEFTGDSANYAASTEAEVRTAIEADINDGN